jgi:hypothetical protein
MRKIVGLALAASLFALGCGGSNRQAQGASTMPNAEYNTNQNAPGSNPSAPNPSAPNPSSEQPISPPAEQGTQPPPAPPQQQP